MFYFYFFEIGHLNNFFVIGFTSRPVLQVRRWDGHGQYALTFVFAISKFGARLTRGDLQVAYGRARESFNGQLQQNFAVLHESGGGKSGVVVAGPSMGGVRKSGHEDGGVAGSAKRQDWSGSARGNNRGRSKKWKVKLKNVELKLENLGNILI